MENKDISVIFLCWYPYGITSLETFLTSYKRFNAGIKHELIIIFKDFTSEKDILNFKNSNLLKEIDYISYEYNGGYDIDAYFFAARNLTTPFLCFLNSKSEILSSDWLKNFYIGISKSKTGAVGATGSWASYTTSVSIKYPWRWEFDKTFFKNLKKYKTLVKNKFYWSWFFCSFPNPHLRTNAFIIDRQLMLKIRFKGIKNKFQAYAFESGKNGFSKQLIKLGYQLMLVNNEGEFFEIKEWSNSNTFWQKNQSNLLIADNQTNIYHTADLVEKKIMSLIAWGK